MYNKFRKIAFVTSDHTEAVEAGKRLSAKYSQTAVDKADIIVALGGDGLMLQTLHAYIKESKPIYGMNRGSVGFLMNEYSEDNLIKRLVNAQRTCIHPLLMTAEDKIGRFYHRLAINEVSLFRVCHQAAKLKISVDNKVRMPELIGDGILVATPAGSTAYNLSAQGPIIPIKAPLLALTPLCPFRPRRWRGALLSNKARISIDVLEATKRPVIAVADHHEVSSVVKVCIEEARNINLIMLFDPDHNLDERILSEQFLL
ncbi:MAG: NAD kinase [Hyphomicrobiaceae bacterium]|nr:NAD kinase [Hyphomicrobiaceae bacterium]